MALKKDPDGFLNEIHGVYQEALTICRQFRGLHGFEALKTRIFSDNMIIATPVDASAFFAEELTACGYSESEKLYFFIFLLANVQSVGLQSGLLIRGGVTIGDLYVDDIMVIGRGLVRAYELESQAAVYPRVLLDSSIVEYMEHDWIVKDFDGFHYIDYLKAFEFVSANGVIRDESGKLQLKKGLDPVINEYAQEATDRFKEKIAQIQALDWSNQPNRVSAKLNWHARYVASFLYGPQWSKELALFPRGGKVPTYKYIWRKQETDPWRSGGGKVAKARGTRNA